MPSVFILVRSHYSTRTSSSEIREFHGSVCHTLSEAVPGFEGSQVFVSTREPGDHLIVYRYRDVDSAEEGLRVVAQDAILAESQRVQSQPAEVMRVKILKEFGPLHTDLSAIPLISLSIRVAEPGFEQELQEDLLTVFQQCALIEGFTGYAIGANDVLAEEIVGLASWNSVAAFRASLPNGKPVAVASYKRPW